MMKRILALLAALALMLSCAGALAEAAETEEAAPVLLATVNGVEITDHNSDLVAAYTHYLNQAYTYGEDITSEDTLHQVKSLAMGYAVRMSILRQKAVELGVSPTEEELQAAAEQGRVVWAESVDQVATDYYGMTEGMSEAEMETARESARTMLWQQYGYDEESFVVDYVDSEGLDLIIARVQEKVLNLPEVTDEEIEARFNALVEEDMATFCDPATYDFATTYYGMTPYYRPEGYRGIIHSLLPVDEALMNEWMDLTARLEEQNSEEPEEPAEGAESTETAEATEEPVTPEMVAAAEQAILDSVKPTLDEINAALAAGTPFTELIAKYGTDPGMQDPAILAGGYEVHPDSGTYDPSFVSAAMKLQNVGDVSEPFVTQFGVHILQYLRDIPGGATELTDELRASMREEIETENRSAAFEEVLQSWEAVAVVTYTEEGESWHFTEEELAELNATPVPEDAVEETPAPADAAEETPAPEEAPEETPAP